MTMEKELISMEWSGKMDSGWMESPKKAHGNGVRVLIGFMMFMLVLESVSGFEIEKVKSGKHYQQSGKRLSRMETSNSVLGVGNQEKKWEYKEALWKKASRQSRAWREYREAMQGRFDRRKLTEETFDASVCDDGGEMPAQCCELQCVTEDYSPFICAGESCFTTDIGCSCGCSGGYKTDDSCCQSDCNLSCEANTTCAIFEQECQCIPDSQLNLGSLSSPKQWTMAIFFSLALSLLI